MTVLRDFYNTDLGAWVTIVFGSFGKFGINIKDMFGQFITYPKFVLAVKFSIEKLLLLSICILLFLLHFTMMLIISNFSTRRNHTWCYLWIFGELIYKQIYKYFGAYDAYTHFLILFFLKMLA